MKQGQLQACPECGGRWPAHTDYALRGCGWLSDLPRGASATNADVDLHDGAGGRNRFLRLELKRREEPWPPSKGQLRYLQALAALPQYTVRIARGDVRDLDLYRVTEWGLDDHPIATHAEALRRAIATWLGGAAWREAEPLLASRPTVAADHTHGWARVDGIWTCVQDYFAVGIRPDTACGLTMAEGAYS